MTTRANPESHRESPPETIGCWLVVPAHNEEGRIRLCLEAVASSQLPAAYSWRFWTVLDDFSTDATVAAARDWASGRSSPPLSVVVSPTRVGKAGALESFHRGLVADSHISGDGIVVVADADASVDPVTLGALLEPFIEDPATSVVWGADRADDTSIGRWASAFQMDLVTELARRRGSSTPRAYGRLFAYRLRALSKFAWTPDRVDDISLARFVTKHGLISKTAWGATVAATPARGYRDFYLQTYRGYWARFNELSRPMYAGDRRPQRWAEAASFAKVASRHPAWASSYAFARVVAAGYHRFRPAEFKATWTVSASTKEPADSQPRSGPLPVAKASPLSRAQARLALLGGCRKELSNWPTVLVRGSLSRCGLRPGVFTVVSRTGFTLRAPNQVLSWSPLVEVLGGDVYRLRALSWPAPVTPSSVLDIGAHVGSFTCALAARLPEATFTCVEPSPSTLVWLRGNLARNGLAERTLVVPAAVTDADSEVELWDTDDVSCEASLLRGQRARRTIVDGLSFDTIMARAGGRASIVKLDCEGGEYAAVLGASAASWSTVERLFLEYHPVDGHTFGELFTRLGELGMRLIWHDRDPCVRELGMAYFAHD